MMVFLLIIIWIISAIQSERQKANLLNYLDGANAIKNVRAYIERKNNINILISTGGYMSLPLCISAKILNLKIYLFEPNMVIGRANIFFIILLPNI